MKKVSQTNSTGQTSKGKVSGVSCSQSFKSTSDLNRGDIITEFSGSLNGLSRFFVFFAANTASRIIAARTQIAPTAITGPSQAHVETIDIIQELAF